MLKIRRVKVYDGGMRVVDMSVHDRVSLWAQCYNTDAKTYVDPYNEEWIIVEFPNEKFTTLYILSSTEDLEIQTCD